MSQRSDRLIGWCIAGVALYVGVGLLLGIIADIRHSDAWEMLELKDPAQPASSVVFQPRRSPKTSSYVIRMFLKDGRRLEEVLDISDFVTSAGVSRFNVESRTNGTLEVRGWMPVRQVLQPWAVNLIPAGCTRLWLQVFERGASRESLTSLDAAMKEGVLAVGHVAIRRGRADATNIYSSSPQDGTGKHQHEMTGSRTP